MKNLVSFICIVLSLNLQASDPNKVIFKGSYKAALHIACQEKKLLLLQFTAKWCQPCRFMEKEVFGNADVQAFVEQNVIIYKVDIDDPQNKELKREYQVSVLPTIVLKRASGSVLARKEHSLNPEAFISWVEQEADQFLGNKSKSKPDVNPFLHTQASEHSNEWAGVEAFLNADETARNKKSETDFQETTVGLSIHETGNFALQAGVFSQKENAESLALNLIEKYQIDIRIAEETRKDKKLFKVIAGQFETQEEAKLFQDFLQRQNLNSVVVDNKLTFVR
ncbi:MAG: SPOR domain-containing protein [Saprospiraceae bacterium]|nr:SPOR domain-containing protein [Saprospiraceae bacterium]